MLDAISGKVVVPTDVSTPSTMPKKSSAPPVSVPENGNATGNAADLSATTDVSAAPAFPAATQSSEEHAVGAITSNIPASESQRAVDASKPATSGEKGTASSRLTVTSAHRKPVQNLHSRTKTCLDKAPLPQLRPSILLPRGCLRWMTTQ